MVQFWFRKRWFYIWNGPISDCEVFFCQFYGPTGATQIMICMQYSLIFILSFSPTSPSYPQAVKSIATTVHNFSYNSQLAITFYPFWLPSSSVACISLNSCTYLFFSGLFPKACSVVCLLSCWKALQMIKAIFLWIWKFLCS